MRTNWIFESVYGPLGRPLGGLAWDGEGMLFSDINESQILRFDPESRSVSVQRRFTNRTNGIAFSADGTLFGCQEGSRRVVRYLCDGSAATTATRLGGRIHNHPCMVAIDRIGQVWFSDPHHEWPTLGPQIFPLLEHQSVLRLRRDAFPRLDWKLERMTYDTTAPRGVALSPDGTMAFVAESSLAVDGRRELRAYPIQEDGFLGNATVLHTFGADGNGVHRGFEGLCVGSEGHVLGCAGWSKSSLGSKLYVVCPKQGVLEAHVLPCDLPLNCAFGDSDRRTLYVTTAAGELLRTRDSGLQGVA